MYYTKQQRIKIYEAAADYFAGVMFDGPVFGFCSAFSVYAIPYVMGGRWFGGNLFLLKSFPEIWEYCPSERVGGFRWFQYDENGFAKRLAILLIAIDKLKAEL